MALQIFINHENGAKFTRTSDCLLFLIAALVSKQCHTHTLLAHVILTKGTVSKVFGVDTTIPANLLYIFFARELRSS